MTDLSFAVRDRIHIEQLEVSGRFGVTEKERSDPQRLAITITAWPQDTFDDLRDDIDRAVDYSEMCLAVRQVVEKRSDKLIETLATQVAARLLEKFPIRAVEIEVRKFVLPGVQYVSVKVHREKSGG